MTRLHLEARWRYWSLSALIVLSVAGSVWIMAKRILENENAPIEYVLGPLATLFLSFALVRERMDHRLLEAELREDRKERNQMLSALCVRADVLEGLVREIARNIGLDVGSLQTPSTGIKES